MELLHLLFALWYAIGFAAPFYFFYRDWNRIEVEVCLIAIMAGLIGPAAWMLGLTIHGPRNH